MKIRLTDLAIKKLPFSEKGQVTYWDELTPNFGVRCSAKSKSYIVLLGEKRRRKTLGRYPGLSLSDARKQAKQLLANNAFAVAESSARPQTSFSEAKLRFLEDSRGRNKARTAADYARLLNKHFNFAGDLRDVSRQQVMKVISGLSGTPSERSHAYVAIRTMMNWCVRQGLIDHSVVPTIKHVSEPRTRFLSDLELSAVYAEAGNTAFPFGPIIQLLIITGQRRSEVGQLRWSWLRDDLLVFPEGFTKNKREHQFPITRKVRKILDALPHQGDLLFPAVTNQDKPFSGWAWHKARFDEGLDDVQPYKLHDLRRTFATVHAKLGTPIHVTERLLNHVSGTVSGVAAIYNRHSYLSEMIDAQKNYERFIEDLA